MRDKLTLKITIIFLGKMTCTNQQVKILMKVRQKYPLETAAAKAGMCSKTAKKYLKLGRLPSACKIEREHRTRIDRFANHWPEVAAMLDGVMLKIV